MVAQAALQAQYVVVTCFPNPSNPKLCHTEYCADWYRDDKSHLSTPGITGVIAAQSIT